MKNLNRQDFETAWRDRFEDYSVEPAELLWIKLDAVLANEESGKYRKRAFYLQMIAAASVLLAIVAGFLMVRHYSTPRPISQTLTEINSQKPGKGIDINKDQAQGKSGENTKINTVEPGSVTRESVRPNNIPIVNNKIISHLKNNDHFLGEENINRDINFLQKRELMTSAKPDLPELITDDHYELYQTSVLPSVALDNKLWVGINMGTGVFDPNITYGSRNNLLALDKLSGNQAAYVPSSVSNISNSLIEKPDYNPGITLALGINVGHDLGKKWIIQAGLGFQQANSSTNVNTFVESAGNNNKYAYQAVGMNAMNFTGPGLINNSGDPIELTSTYDFLQIPVTMGYKLYDKAIRWMINGGVSPVVLLNNKIYNSDNLVDEIKLSPGTDSPYKSLSFNGVVGTSVGLSLFGNYQLSITPAYNFGLGYLTKNMNNFNSRPSNFMVSGNLSYIFN